MIMKMYAVFYHNGAISNKPIPACGDRATIQIDNRIMRSGIDYIAKQECKKRGYLGYHLESGESLLRAKPITDYIPA
jgi:hypothetical protein